jgi:hypothetical protein
MDWWVARTEPRRELAAVGWMARRGLEVYCPVVKALRRDRGRLRERLLGEGLMLLSITISVSVPLPTTFV